MANTERLSISISKENAAAVRELVASGSFASVSAAFDTAAHVLLQHQAEKQAWIAEINRICDEAEANPERCMDLDTFFAAVDSDIEALKKTRTFKP